MKKVLITGIDSFTGKHLSLYLKKQGYDLFGTSLATCDDKTFKCDITKIKDLENIFKNFEPNFLIHLCGISFAAHDKVEDFYRVNTIGTTNILDTLVKYNINPEKILIASSAAVYGNQDSEILDENLCPKPSNHYGASKYAMECMVKNYFEKLNIIITRPFNYTGVGQDEHFLIPKIVSSFKKKNKNIELGNLDVSREFNDISFVCDIYTKLLKTDTKSQVVNICSNKAIKLLDVISKMNEIAKYTIEVKVNPDFIRKDEIKTLRGSIKKLESIIGKINYIPLSKTLEKIYNFK